MEEDLSSAEMLLSVLNPEYIELVPSPDGDNCPGNGKQENIEICCDECEYFLVCFPGESFPQWGMNYAYYYYDMEDSAMEKDMLKITDVVDMDALTGSLILLINKTSKFLGLTEKETAGYELIIDSKKHKHKLNAAYKPDSNSFILYTENLRAYREDEITLLNKLFNTELPLEYRYIIAVYNMMFHEVRHFYQYRIAIRSGDTVFPKDIDEAEKDAEAFEAYMCIRFLHESFTGDSIPEDNIRIKQHLTKIKDEYRDMPLGIYLADLLDSYHKAKKQ